MNRHLLPYFLMILLVSCSANDNKIERHSDNTTHFTGNTMTIDYHIIVGKSLNDNEITKIKTLIYTTFKEIDSIYNKWNPNSELSRLNNLKAGMKVSLSPDLENLLQHTQRIVELSNGRFDPTIEPLQKLWKTKLQQGNEPANSEIAIIAPAIGWDKIHFGNGIFSKSHDLTEIDLGGIAKGFCVDLLAERLNNEGWTNIYVEWGGEIRCAGRHPDNRPWTISISRLGDTDPLKAIATITLDNSSIATSGDYLQNWTIASSSLKNKDSRVTYFHIFDPKTLRPLESSRSSIASASVIASSCALADGLATTAMMFPTLIEAESWANSIKEKFPEVSFWLVSRN